MTLLGARAAIIDGILQDGDVRVEDGILVETGLPAGPGGIAVARAVDLQVNGFAGIDLLGASSVDEIRELCRALHAAGTGAFLATLITSPLEHMLAAERLIARAMSEQGPGEARILGIHLEGPFLSPERPGVHPLEHLRDPSVGELEQMLAAGPVVEVTLAPERAGALDLVSMLVSRGVLVSIGHTAATSADARAAFDAGARTLTHAFNAMHGVTSRAPGPVGAALLDQRITPQCIVDGAHLSDETAGLLVSAFDGRLAVVSDAVAPAGAGGGAGQLGSHALTGSTSGARRSDGVLAGGMSALMESVPRLRALGLSLVDAVACVTTTPARLAGRPELGVLRLGAPADPWVLPV